MTHSIGSWLRLLMGFVLVTLSFSAAALTCATPGKDGAGGVLNAPINRYWPATVSNTDYKGYTDLIGAEARHDLTKRWDVGAFGSVMRSLNSGVRSYGLGASVGYKLVDNMWLSAGYNVRGMNDRDFSNASYRARGPFITLRMKVDQDTFGLNKSGEILHPEILHPRTPE